MSTREQVERLVVEHLAGAGIDHEAGGRPGEVVATLPGEHKLRTTVSLLVGDHSLSASAFVVRRPDENTEEVHRWLPCAPPRATPRASSSVPAGLSETRSATRA